MVENLFDDDIVAVAAIQNRWTRRRRIELAELVNASWTLPSASYGNLGAAVVEALSDATVQKRIADGGRAPRPADAARTCRASQGRN